jgi:protein translocase SecG subunit
VQILISILTVVSCLLGALLVFVVVIQTPKSEGFTGGVANVQGGGFRGKTGYEEILSNYTRIVAVAWFATTFLVAVLSEISK